MSEDTKIILEQMDKRFEQIDKRLEQMDKRFEQVDKRFDLMQQNMDIKFEEVDKRFETVFNILYILMGLIFASPFIAIYLRDKKDAEDKKNFDNIKGILFVLKELAQDNEKVAKSLRAASLL
ncbi:MAG: hypothetical protein JJV88_06020 [Sulfurovum sp.]|nr:hypothetical protein [Sulfurovaceae bacterium]